MYGSLYIFGITVNVLVMENKHNLHKQYQNTRYFSNKIPNMYFQVTYDHNNKRSPIPATIDVFLVSSINLLNSILTFMLCMYIYTSFYILIMRSLFKNII